MIWGREEEKGVVYVAATDSDIIDSNEDVVWIRDLRDWFIL